MAETNLPPSACGGFIDIGGTRRTASQKSLRGQSQCELHVAIFHPRGERAAEEGGEFRGEREAEPVMLAARAGVVLPPEALDFIPPVFPPPLRAG